VLADAREIHEPIDRPQQVIGRNMPLKVELVEESLLSHSIAHAVQEC
jgi:hypothetical protein